MYLLPEVKKKEERAGRYCLPFNGEIAVDLSVKEESRDAVSLLKKYVQDICGISLSLNAAVTELTAVRFEKKETGHAEGYELEISSEGIVLRAGNSRGWIYAVQTLRQILSQEGLSLPCLLIEDYPSLEIRGFMHDVTRSRVPSMESMKAMADWCSRYKLNHLELYVEHTYLFPQFSEMWRDDTPLTAEDILELDDYCASRGVELVPCIASFGHLFKLLRTKGYRRLSEFEDEDGRTFSFVERMQHHTLNPLDPDGIALVRDMIHSYAPLFKSGLFNICCDETFDLGKGKSIAEAEKYGVGKLYTDFLNQVCDAVRETGKRPMYWGDVLLAHPEWIEKLPKDGIFLNWNYAPNAEEERVSDMKAMGVTQVLCPGVHGWNHLLNLLDDAYANITRMCGFAHKYGAMGTLNTDWGDFGHINHPAFSLPGLICGASASWSENPLDREEFDKAVSAVEYGDASGELMKALTQASASQCCSWRDMIHYMEVIRFGVFGQTEEEIYANLHYENALQANKELDDAKEALCRVSAGMAPCQRKRLAAYLTAIEGQKIFNAIGADIDQYRFRKENAAAVDPWELAAKLERWFYDYKKLWRSVSREAELWELQQAVNWYADFLRDLKTA